MSEPAKTPPTDQTPDNPKPDKADKRPRARTKEPEAPVTNPEAPYGYMKDPTAPGGVRPKLRPGRQSTTGQQAPPPPKDRPANKARSAAPGTTVKATQSQMAKDVTALIQGSWLLLASVPEADVKIPGTKRTIADVAVRTRAQAAILEDNADGLVKGLVIAGQNSAPVARFISKMGEETGPAWIIPAMLAVVPFVVQSAAMWNAPAEGAVRAAAERTKTELDAMLRGTQTPEGSPNGHDGTAATGAAVPDAQNDQGTAVQPR